MLDTLAVPIVGAPMAGGPTTPELVAAVSNAGGIGFLAAGYLSADALAERIAATRALTDKPFGVNLFVPGPRADPRTYADYVADLGDPRWDDDAWDAKLELLAREPVAAVSYTFGCPDPLPDLPAEAWVTVTSLEEARAAVAAGADALVAQGGEAGGHRGTWVDAPGIEPLGLLALLQLIAAADAAPRGDAAVAHDVSRRGPAADGAPRDGAAVAHDVSRRGPAGDGAARDDAAAAHDQSLGGPAADGAPRDDAAVAHDQSRRGPAADGAPRDAAAAPGDVPRRGPRDVPVVAAGGIGTPAAVRAALALGASAVQVGTAFLLADEAGTVPAYRERLAAGGAPTGLTRAFSGRLARGIQNRFMDEHPDAPLAYPEIHHATAQLRAAARAAGDADGFNLWAGEAYPLARAWPAADITRWLAGVPQSGVDR